MNTRGMLVLAAAVVGSVSLAMQASASTVSVQFPQYYGTGIVSPLNSQNLNYQAGVEYVRNWNVAGTPNITVKDINGYDVAVPNTVTNANLVDGSGAASGTTVLMDSTGAATGLAFSFSYVRSDGVGVSVDNTHTPPAGKWAQVDWWDSGNHNGDAYLAGGANFTQDTGANPVSLTISGLDPATTYNLIAYVGTPWWADGSTGAATAGGITKYVTTSKALGTWVPVTSTTSGSPTVGNYVEFDGLTGSASQTLAMSGNFLGLGGFQITEAVPEPATLGLLGLGAFTLLSKRRRQA